MKKSLMLVMSACLLAFSSCQKSTIDNVSKNQQTSTTTADQSHHIYARTTWGNLGTIHNDIMQYANDNQTLFDTNSYTLLVTSVKDVLSNYLETDYPGYHDTPTINEFKYFCNPDTTYGRLANINNDLEFLEEAEVMTLTEREHIEDIIDVIFEVKNNTATIEDYYQTLLEKKDAIAEENFEFANRFIDIGISSYEYWTDYWDNVEPPVSGIANWVAQDAAGALVAGTVAAVREYSSTGDVTLSNVGTTALIGGALASVGLVSKVARGIKKYFS